MSIASAPASSTRPMPQSQGHGRSFLSDQTSIGWATSSPPTVGCSRNLKNPIALGFHRIIPWPIGTWKQLRVEHPSLRGQLELAPEGHVARASTKSASWLTPAFLRAVSVGFRPMKASRSTRKRPLVRPQRYIEQSWSRARLCRCRRTPNAIAVAKSLKFPPQRSISSSPSTAKRDGSCGAGSLASTPRPQRDTGRGSAMSLDQRITDCKRPSSPSTSARPRTLPRWTTATSATLTWKQTPSSTPRSRNSRRPATLLVESEKLAGKTARQRQRQRPGVSAQPRLDHDRSAQPLEESAVERRSSSRGAARKNSSRSIISCAPAPSPPRRRSGAYLDEPRHRDEYRYGDDVPPRSHADHRAARRVGSGDDHRHRMGRRACRSLY